MARNLRKRPGNGIHKHSRLNFEKLEQRNLLAGDVLALVNGAVLEIVGDDLANQIQVSTVNDSITIEGLDTTVNGSVDAVTIDQAFRHITISLSDGDDEVDLHSITSPSNLTIYGGNGNDLLRLGNTNAFHMHLETGAGNDVVELTNTSTRKSSYVYLGAGNDLLAINSHQSGRNFKVFGGEGDDLFVSDQLNVRRKFSVHLNNGTDQVLIAGETSIGHRTRISTGRGDDAVIINPIGNDSVTFHRWVKADLGAGNDVFVVQNEVDFQRRTRIKGGSGADQLQNSVADLGNVRFRNFESSSVSGLQQILDDVFSRLADAGIDATPFGGTTDSSQIELLVDDSTLNIVENAAPTTVDSSLQVSGSSGIESARVEIIDFVAEQEQLAFDDSLGVSGVFDEDSGVLSLTGDASTETYQQVLRSVSYENTSDDPPADDRIVRFTVFDQSANPVFDERAISIEAVDDPLTLTLPSPFNSDSAIARSLGGAIEFSANGFDPDSNLVYQLDLDESGIPATSAQPIIDSETGLFEWTPDTTGEFPIRVIAVNDLGQADQEEFLLSIS